MQPMMISNAVPRMLFDRVQHEILSNSVGWHYLPSTAYGQMTQDGSSFTHSLVYDGEYTSTMSRSVEAAILAALSVAGIEVAYMIRIRIGMIMKTPTPYIHAPHVDHDIPHLTGLLYINEADGNTVLYKEKYSGPVKGLNAQDYFELELNSKVNVDTTITPEPNKLVVFDGLTYHSSTTPTQVDRRIVVNFNFVPK